MNTHKALMLASLVLTALAAAFLFIGPAAFSLPNAPPPQVQGLSFTTSTGGPLGNTGVHPADLLSAGGVPLVACENLGLLCTDGATGAKDEILGLSFGDDFSPQGLPGLLFSVAPGSQGAPTTAVRLEASCTLSEALSDAFETLIDSGNLQDLDGDGIACSSNSGFGLLISEGASIDELAALERDPCQSIDFDCDGIPEAPVYLTLKAGSPSLVLINATPADILVSGATAQPQVWASAAQLGLRLGDVIDALCIRSNGSLAFTRQDQILLSLAPGSPSLAALNASPADLFHPAPLGVAYHASQLGLLSSDNLDALLCDQPLAAIQLMLPVIRR
jgi:hypothetical protein